MQSKSGQFVVQKRVHDSMRLRRKFNNNNKKIVDFLQHIKSKYFILSLLLSLVV